MVLLPLYDMLDLAVHDWLDDHDRITGTLDNNSAYAGNADA